VVADAGDATDTGATIISTSAEAHPEGIDVYNLEVEGDHTYFVEDGAGPVWVHNSYDPTARMTPSNLQKNYKKHGKDFGLQEDWQGKDAARLTGALRDAVNEHLSNPDNITIIGGYRGKPGFVHVLNKGTGIDVVLDGDGYFVAGFKLFPSQLQNLLR